MFELNFSKYSIIAPVTWRGRCEVFAESRYAIPVSKIGKSFLIAATSYETLGAPCARPAIAISVEDLDEDVAAFDGHGVRLRGDDSRQGSALARDQVEARSVLRALDVHAPKLTVAQAELLVRADVVEGIELSVLGMSQTYGRASGLDPLHGFVGQLFDRSDPVPSQDASPAQPRQGCERGRTGSGPARRRRSPARASASPSARESHESANRTFAAGRRVRRSRRACSGRRCCRSRASGSRSPWRDRRGRGFGWPGRRPTARHPFRSGSIPRKRCARCPAARP